MKVVPLFDGGSNADIPLRMRQSADAIAAETDDDDRTVAVIAVHVTEDGRIEVYGWGRTDGLHAIGALTAAARQLC